MVVENKQIARKWYSTYARAKAYYKENGNLDVPARYVDPVTGTKLGAWIANQRYARRPGSKNQTITPEQIRLLDEIGMNWGREGGNMDAWDEYIERISAYKEAHGDCRVPKAYVDPKDGYKLGKLVSTLRSINRGTDARSIPAGYKEKLDEVGFFWVDTPTTDVVGFLRTGDRSRKTYISAVPTQAKGCAITPSCGRAYSSAGWIAVTTIPS